MITASNYNIGKIASLYEEFYCHPITGSRGQYFTGSHIVDIRNCLLPYLIIFYSSASVAVALFIKTSASLEIASPCGSRE